MMKPYAYEILLSANDDDDEAYLAVELEEGSFDEDSPDLVWVCGMLESGDYNPETGELADLDSYLGGIWTRLLFGEYPVNLSRKEQEAEKLNLYVVQRVIL